MRALPLALLLVISSIFWIPTQARADSICHTPASSFNASLAVELGVCDASGNLMIKTVNGSTSATPGYTRIQDGTTTNLATVNGAAGADAQAATLTLATQSFNIGYNGTTWDRLRTANATTGIGQLLTTIAGPSGAQASVYGAAFAPTGIGASSALAALSYNMGYNGSTYDSFHTLNAPNQPGIQWVGQEPAKSTFSAISNNGAAQVVQSGVNASICNAAGTRTVRVRHVDFSGNSTAAGSMVLLFQITSTLYTGGTPTTMITASFDSANTAPATPTAATVSYSAAPAGGALTGYAYNAPYLFSPSSVGAPIVAIDFGTRNEEALALHTNQCLGIVLTGTVPTGAAFFAHFTSTEE
jgi:hypothetical protein